MLLSHIINVYNNLINLINSNSIVEISVLVSGEQHIEI